MGLDAGREHWESGGLSDTPRAFPSVAVQDDSPYSDNGRGPRLLSKGASHWAKSSTVTTQDFHSRNHSRFEGRKIDL